MRLKDDLVMCMLANRLMWECGYLLAGPPVALAPWAEAVDPDLLDAF